MEVKIEPEIKSSINEETEKTLPVTRIHFLIHPGFTTDPEEFPEPEDKIILERGEELLKKYLESARNMKEDELMFTFTHTSLSKLKSDIQRNKHYARNLQRLKSILGNRLVVISTKFDIFNTPEAIDKAMMIAKSRGFNIDQGVESVAYGETDGVCVPDAAENFNRATKLRKRTKILLHLTNAIFQNPAIRKRILENQSIHGERVQFETAEIPI
jgi:ADP-dependent phosphofructokinase/glucokinase